MKKAELTRRIAQQSKLSRAAAADQLDRIVHEILDRVRKGQSATLPGLGTFRPGQDAVFGVETSQNAGNQPPRPGENTKPPTRRGGA